MPPTFTDEGVRAAQWLSEHRPEVGVVLFTHYADPEYALGLFEAGSERRSYLLKERVGDIEELSEATRRVASGGTVVDPRIVLAATIRAAGGTAVAVARDLCDDQAAPALFDAAEAAFDAAVRILISNATGWVGDSFTKRRHDHVDRQLRPVSPVTHDQQFAVDARAGGLLIAALAQRHVARGGDWGRIVSLTSGGPHGPSGEASYGAAKAALDNYTMTAAAELGAFGITANSVLLAVTDTGWVTDPVRELVSGSKAHHHVATPGCAPTTPGCGRPTGASSAGPPPQDADARPCGLPR
jgi:NAD(P)-dependent dehydrogenase (short-subunit alcohol dehydrogenase family)